LGYVHFLSLEMSLFQVSPETISFEPSTEHKESRWYCNYTGNYPLRKASLFPKQVIWTKIELSPE
jgi:hypothetical protein